MASLQDVYRARRDAPGTTPGSCWLTGSCPEARHEMLRDLRRHVAARGGELLTGGWRDGLVRPYGGVRELAEELAARVSLVSPELLGSYRFSLTNLVPERARAEGRDGCELQSGLAAFLFHRDAEGLTDFFWRRDFAPVFVAELVHFLLDGATALAAASGCPPVFCLENLERADRQDLAVVEMLVARVKETPLLLCLVAETEPSERLTAAAPPLLTRLEAVPAPHAVERVSARADALGAAAVFASPFRIAEWAPLLQESDRPSAAAQAADMVDEGLLRRREGDRFVVADATLREAAHARLEPAEKVRRHGLALAFEAGDPFAAAWHAAEARQPAAGREPARRALEWAWGVSAYGCALSLARRYLACTASPEVDPDLLFALLYYEAGDFAKTEEHLMQVLGRPQPPVDTTCIVRLIGYNAVFGLRDLERGRTLLESVLPRYEETGQREEAGFVRNSIAFTLFRSGRFEDAVEMERQALEQLGEGDGGRLLTILQLNLARLFRHRGVFEEALGRFRAAHKAGSGFTPYMLQILRASLAHLHAQRGQWSEALREYAHCFELSRDMIGESASYPVFDLLAAEVGKIPAGRLTRGDELFFYLYLNLGIASGRLGLRERSDAYFEGVRGLWGSLGDEVEGVLARAQVAARPLADPGARGGESKAATARGAYASYIEEIPCPSVAERAAELVAAGRAVAVVSTASPYGLTTSLVLCDPRNAPLAARISAELHAPSAPHLRGALVLSESRDWLHGVQDLPLVLQHASLRARGAETRPLPALAAHRLRAQVLARAHDGRLFEILEAFERQTGVGVLGAIAFCVFGWDVADEPRRAIESFLVSSVDHLVLDGVLLGKAAGREAPQNLLPFRPRLSMRAQMLDGTGAGPSKPVVVSVRSWTGRRQLMRMNAEIRPILALCDGNRTVAEIVDRVRGSFPAGGDLSNQVGGLLRTLHRRRAVCFVAPPAEPVK